MTKQSLYTKSLGNAVARLAKPSSVRKYHVISSINKKWAVVSEGRVRPLRSFTTQKSAIAYAKRSAINNAFGEVVIHAKDGMILNKIKI